MDSDTCSECGTDIDFVVGEVDKMTGLLTDDVALDAKFYLACECSQVRVYFGNISIGGPDKSCPEGWE